MVFKELSEKDKDYLYSVYVAEGISHREKMEILSKKFEVSERTIRRWAREKLGIGSKGSGLPSQLDRARNRRIHKDTDVIFFTSAQNKTITNEFMLRYMGIYKELLESKGKKVEIVIAPLRYRNPTSNREYKSNKTEEWWDDRVDPYLFYDKIEFGDTCFYPDYPITPTASNPLSSLEYLAANSNAVLPHSRIHFKTLPRFKGNNLRSLSTCGSISYKNYSHSKAGVKGHFHHSLGFVVVEKLPDGTTTIPRNVKVNNDGSFTDIVWQVDNNGIKKIDSSKGLILGDIHHRELNEQKDKVSRNLAKLINPEVVVLHDLLDASTMNPHEVKDTYIQKKKIREGKYLIKDEVNEALEYANSWGDKCVVLQSNHDSFLDRFLSNDWQKNLHNSEAYLEYALIQQTKDIEKYGNIFGYLISTETNARYVPADEMFQIGDYFQTHGDFGVNGGKGSITSFKRLSFKLIHGHQHSPAVQDSVTAAGVSCKLHQYYNSKGLSSWAYADVMVANTGKAQLLVYRDDYILSTVIDLV